MSAFIITAGQSNAMVFGNSGPAPYAPTSRVQIFDGAHFVEMLPGVNTGTANNPGVWGPEVAIANRWLSDNPSGTLFLLKSAHGSTGMAQDPAELDWSPASRGEMFDITTHLVDAAKAELGALGQPATVTAVMWVDGEQDAISATKAAAAVPNLVAETIAIRAAWADFGTPVIFARLDSAQHLPFEAEIQHAQDLVAASLPDVSVVNTDTLPLQADHLHYAADGAIGLGDELFSALQAYSHTSFGPAWAWPRGDFLDAAQ